MDINNYREDIKSVPRREREAYLLDLLDWYLDPADAEMRLAEIGVELPRRPARMFVCLAKRRGHTVTVDALMAAMYFDVGYDQFPDSNITNVYLSKYRQFFNGSHPFRVENVWGQGFRMTVEDGFIFPWELKPGVAV